MRERANENDTEVGKEGRRLREIEKSKRERERVRVRVREREKETR